jgi:hypothetical protein
LIGMRVHNRLPRGFALRFLRANSKKNFSAILM